MNLELLEHAAVGAPITRLGISLVPVYVYGQTPLPIAPFGDGVVIAEAPDATVPSITVSNTNPEPVLLVEGETVRGGHQDRTMNVSVLVPSLSVIDCPVSCVERGRWGGLGEFGRSKTYASRRVRRAKEYSVGESLTRHRTKRSDQGLVWSIVDYELTRLGIDDQASALRAADEAIARDRRISESVQEIVLRRPLPEQKGVVVMHGRRAVACDLFASQALLDAHWEALVRGYFLDVPKRPEGRPSLTGAVRFLRRFATAPAERANGVGLGVEHHARSDRVVGQALLWDDAIVHASAFAAAV